MSASIKPNGVTTTNVTFGNEMPDAPTVMLTFGGSPGDNTGAASIFGNLQLYLVSTSTTGFTFKLVSASSGTAATATTVYWTAFC